MVGFTAQVRQELSRAPLRPGVPAKVELGVLLRLAARLHRTGTPDGAETSLEVASRSGAVVRRVYALLDQLGAPRPELWVSAPAGVARSTTYGATLRGDIDGLGRHLGLFDRDGRPRGGLPPDAADHPAESLRAAVLATGSLSTPGRPVHVEFGVPGTASANDLVAILRTTIGAGAHDGDRARVVVKSGEAVERLLVLTGATQAFLRWQERRLRLEIRNAVTRLSNADAANVRRTIDAAGDQVAAVETAIAAVGWSGLDDDLRDVALARLANPTASLAELGQLCDPPVGKSAVHRRLERIAAIARDAAAPKGGPAAP